MDKRKEIKILLGKLKNYTIKQSILMNNIIEELLKIYYDGGLTTDKTSNEVISINEIYNKAVQIINEGQICFAYEDESPVCILQLSENIKQLEAIFSLNYVESLRGIKR